jgi:hypothetical protein
MIVQTRALAVEYVQVEAHHQARALLHCLRTHSAVGRCARGTRAVVAAARSGEVDVTDIMEPGDAQPALGHYSLLLPNTTGDLV